MTAAAMTNPPFLYLAQRETCPVVTPTYASTTSRSPLPSTAHASGITTELAAGTRYPHDPYLRRICVAPEVKHAMKEVAAINGFNSVRPKDQERIRKDKEFSRAGNPQAVDIAREPLVSPTLGGQGFAIRNRNPLLHAHRHSAGQTSAALCKRALVAATSRTGAPILRSTALRAYADA
ncbi:hypothetical protein EXIGLDRAFT_772682 [Exidia glandulosa HHB12029]|uniref:Uncharacterized protein n=1 Tax=Exidia glandulosa HHB12029 TaxID=1314781 RepID=A0A165F6U4_EXIGL|nr:hypothetical protein EXIGLDRAFT_772682 [Exidia glandulosa HHB12029]